MKRYLNYSSGVSARLARWAFTLGLLFGCAAWSQAQGQDYREGIWGEVGFDGGFTTKTSKFEGIDLGDTGGVSAYATIGLHRPLGIAPLQLGLGLTRQGFGHPNFLTFHGAHIEAKYRPIERLKGLKIMARLIKPLGVVERGYHQATYDPLVSGSIGAGWEFPRVLGSVGFSMALGLSWTAFDYKYALGHSESGVYKTVSSGQGVLFLRLGVLFN